jgi:DNA-binding IclR family transcriptional regulator
LGNGEIAELTGLPRSTVSRLTQTLVNEGFLMVDRKRHAYKLGAPVLGLAFSMRNSSAVLSLASPLMEVLARREKINVGLALPDKADMVYLESIRYSRAKSIRKVMPGQRIPMDLTSLGRAWLATLSTGQREALYVLFEQRHPRKWAHIKVEIASAISDVRKTGFCAASWLPNVIAVATPLNIADEPYVLNASLYTEEGQDDAAARLAPPLLALAARVRAAAQTNDDKK